MFNARLAALKDDLLARIAQINTGGGGGGSSPVYIQSSSGAYVTTQQFAQQIDATGESLRSVAESVAANTPTLTDTNIPDDITASNYLPLTGGTLTGTLTGTNLTLSGNLTVSGAQTLSGAITVPYLSATSTTQASDFQKLTATHATTSFLFVDTAAFTTASIGGTATSTFSSSGALSLAGALTLSGSLNGPLHANAGVVGATTSIGVLYGGTGLTTAPSYGQLLLGNSSGGYTLTATSSLGLPTFGYLFPSNATSTLLSFSGGLLSLASTTIGAGTQTTGLTISGGATTTGNAYFAGSVGVGTVAPGGALHVAADSNAAILVSNAAGTGNILRISGNNTVDTANPTIRSDGSNLVINGKSGGDLYFNYDTGNTIHFRGTSNYIDSSNRLIWGTGSVGIGTTSPYAKLSVVGPVVAEYFHATSSTASTFAGGLLSLASSTIGNGTQAGGLTISGGATTTATSTLAGLLVTSGNVGIGTAAPSQALEVTGNIKATYLGLGGATPGASITSQTAALNVTGYSFFNGVRINGADLQRSIYGYSGELGIGTNSQDITFSTDTEGATRKMIIQANTGNVGIGTTSPYAKLSVVGPVVAEYFHATSSTATSTFSGILSVGTTTPASSSLFSVGTSSSLFTISKSSGNVGIGTTTPSQKFVVQTSSDVNGFAHTDGTVTVGSWVGSGVGQLGTISNHPLEFFTNNDDAQITLLTNGNVGIGTTTPPYKLSIYDPTGAGLMIAGGDGSTGIDFVNTGASDKAWGFYSLGTDFHLFEYNSTVQVGTGIDRVTFKAGGNVGIATTSPWRTFSVSGTVSLANMTAAQAGSVLCLSADNEVTTDSTPASPCSSSLLANKQNVADLGMGLDAVMRLRPVEFDWKDGFGRGHDLGFIAEEVQEAAPILADYNLDGSLSSVKYTQVGALLTKAIQEIASITGTFKASLIAWLADAANGITDFFAQVGNFGRVNTGELCTTTSDGTEVCASGDQLAAILSAQAGAPSAGGNSEAPAPPAREDADAATSTTLSDNAPIINTTPQAAAGASPIEQSNSTGQANTGGAREAPDGLPAPGAVSADTTTSTTPDSPTAVPESTTPIPQQPAASDTAAQESTGNQTQIVAEQPSPTEPPPLPPAANDNSPPSDEQLATGTE